MGSSDMSCKLTVDPLTFFIFLAPNGGLGILRTWPFFFFAGNSQEYSYTPQLHIKEMIAGVEVGVATKWLAVQVGVDSAVMPAMVADFVRTNCFCRILVVFTDEESVIQQCQTLSIFFIFRLIIVV
jgi:hypothetical protein